MLYERKWVKFKPEGKVPFLNPKDPSKCKVSIMQWNIFAQGFASVNEFIHCQDQYLELSKRVPLFVQEIMHQAPDIICLQEADIIEQIVHALNLRTDDASYSYEFIPKTQSECLKIEGNLGPDGIAIIYNTKTVGKQQRLDLQIDAHGRHALFVKFCLQSCQNRDFYVGCTHLKAKMPFADVRLAEGRVIVDFINNSLNSDVPVIFCGDFNAEPHEPVLESFKTNPQRSFQSVYAMVNGGEEPHFTTWKFRGGPRSLRDHEVKHTIDYIFFSGHRIQPISVLALPSEDVIGPYGIPTPSFPSDHFDLVAEFLLQ